MDEGADTATSTKDTFLSVGSLGRGNYFSVLDLKILDGTDGEDRGDVVPRRAVCGDPGPLFVGGSPVTNTRTITETITVPGVPVPSTGQNLKVASITAISIRIFRRTERVPYAAHVVATEGASTTGIWAAEWPDNVGTVPRGPADGASLHFPRSDVLPAGNQGGATAARGGITRTPRALSRWPDSHAGGKGIRDAVE